MLAFCVKFGITIALLALALKHEIGGQILLVLYPNLSRSGTKLEHRLHYKNSKSGETDL